MTKRKSDKKIKTVPEKIWDISTTVAVIIVVILAVLLAGVRLIGLTPYAILSGSMEPQYHVGSVIYVKKCNPEDVSVGDAISFVLNDDLVVATHQVCEIDSENQKFYTQGIANRDDDGNIQRDGEPVCFENLIGKPVFNIPLLGYISNVITNPPGSYFAIAAAVILIIVVFVPSDKKKSAKSADTSDGDTKSD